MEARDEVADLRALVAALRLELRGAKRQLAMERAAACGYALELGRKFQRLQDRLAVAAVANKKWRDAAGEVRSDLAASFAECADKLQHAVKGAASAVEANVWATAAVIVWAHAQARHGFGDPPAEKAAS